MSVTVDRQFMTVRQAAKRLKAGRETVRRWIRSGKLRAIQPGGQRLGYRIPSEDVERLLVEGVPS